MTSFFDSFDHTSLSENGLVNLENLYLTPKQPIIPNTAKIKNDTQFYDRIYFEKFYSTYTNIVLFIVFILFIICVIGSNLLIIHGIFELQRKMFADFYLISLALIDVLVGILVIPFMCLSHLQGYFPLGSKVCGLWIFFDYYLIVSSSWCFAGLMLNYLWMMSWPKNYKTVNSRRHFTIISTCFVLALISWVPPYFRLNDDNDIRGVCGYSVIEHTYFSLYIGILGLYIPGLFCILTALWCGYSLYIYRTTDRIFLSELVPQGHQAPIFLVKVLPVEKELAMDYMEQANLHLPSSLVQLFIFLASRCAFYIYFGTGSFIPNFFPPDLSNGVYWIMHSNALAAPILHVLLDSELRGCIRKMIRIKRRPRIEPLSILHLT